MDYFKMTFLKFCPVKSIFKRNNEQKDEERDSHHKRMSTCRKISYGMGGPPMQMTSNAMAFYLPIFLLETALITPFHLSIVQILARVWDALTDPLAGYLVSITKSRFGKFKPWIVFATPISCVAFFLQFYVPNTSNQLIKCLFYSIVVMALQTGLTAFHVPYSSMCMVLTSNPHDRDQLTSIRMGFEIIGILFGAGVFGGIALRNRIMNKENNYTVTIEEKDTEKRNYMEASGVVCVIFILCAISVLFGTKEKKYIKAENPEPYYRSLKKILTFKPYLFVMFAFMFTSLGIQIIQSNLALYVTHTLNRPKHVIPGIMVLLCCSLAFVPVGHILMRKLGKKMVFAMGGVNMFPILISLMFLPKNLNLIIYYAYMVWVSFSLMVAMVLPWSMLPDVIDMFIIENGSHKEAVFYSFYVFFNKFAVGISLSFSAIALGLAGYISESKVQPPSVASMLRYFIGVSGIICFTFSMIFLYYYPITEEKRRQIAIELEKMRENFINYGKLPINTTCESNLDCIEVGFEPSKEEKAAVDEAAQLILNPINSIDVDFVIGSDNNLLRT